MSSSRFVRFARVGHLCLWVQPGWLGSLESALGYSGLWLGSCAPRQWLSSSGFVRVRSSGGWVHPRSLGALAGPLVVVNPLSLSSCPGCRWVDQESLNSLTCAVVVVGFMGVCWIHSRTLYGSLYSFAFVCFTRLRPWGRWSHPRSLRSLARAMGVVGFILRHWVHWRALWGSFGSSGVVGFTRTRTWSCCVHVGSLGSLVYAVGVVGFIRGSWCAPWFVAVAR